MKLREFLTDTKTYILLIIFFIGIGTAFAGIIKIPKRVDKVEEQQKKTEESVQKVANTVDKFMMEQRVIRDEENKREALMLKLIEKLEK